MSSMFVFFAFLGVLYAVASKDCREQNHLKFAFTVAKARFELLPIAMALMVCIVAVVFAVVTFFTGIFLVGVFTADHPSIPFAAMIIMTNVLLVLVVVGAVVRASFSTKIEIALWSMLPMAMMNQLFWLANPAPAPASAVMMFAMYLLMGLSYVFGAYVMTQMIQKHQQAPSERSLRSVA